MFYSSRHEGYFLTIQDAEFPSNKKLLVYFTKDLENWELRKYFINAWEGSLIELPDGTLVLVYMKFGEQGSTDLYLTTSDDGVSWTTPKKLELIVDEEALRKIPPIHVSNSSVVVSLVATVSALIILHRRPFLILGKTSIKECAGF
jgi:hypothetical protein